MEVPPPSPSTPLKSTCQDLGSLSWRERGVHKKMCRSHLRTPPIGITHHTPEVSRRHMMALRQLVAVAALGAVLLIDRTTQVEACSCIAQYKSVCEYAAESAVVAHVKTLDR